MSANAVGSGRSCEVESDLAGGVVDEAVSKCRWKREECGLGKTRARITSHQSR